MTDGLAITGSAAVTALGSPPDLWRRLRAGERVERGLGEVPLVGVPDSVRARALRAERLTQLVLAAAGPALAAAGLAALDGPPRPRLGVVVGTALGCFLTNGAHERRLLAGGPAATSPRLFAATVSNAAAGELAIAYRLGGPSVTVSAGAASGLVALGHAMDIVAAGRADALVAGGADALGEDVAAWAAASGASEPAPPSEGAAFVVVEPVVAARARGATVLGTLAGWAGGFEPDPRRSDGLAGAVEAALAEARVAPAEVALVAGSDGERAPLAPVFACPRLAVGRQLGETLAAAGPLGLLAAVAEAPRGAPVLVVDVCPSGHVAALVARSGDTA